MKRNYRIILVAIIVLLALAGFIRTRRERERQLCNMRTCDPMVCKWKEKTPCAVPGGNCGGAYTPPECVLKGLW